MNAAVRRVAQRVDIPGFRKGKAPRAILQNFVGKDYLVEEAMESLVPEAVGDAVKEQELTPFAPPQVNVEQTEPTVTILATVPLQPTVVISDYGSIRYDDQPDEVTGEAVDALMMQLRRSQAYSVSAERPAQESDIVTIDIKFQLNLDLETYGEVFVGLHQGVIGMEVGDEKEFSFEVSEDHESPQFAGTTAHVEVTLKDVREEVLPEMDDALAVSAGVPEVETVDQLTEHIRDQLEQRAEQTLVSSVQSKFFDEVVEASEFTISPIVVEHESQHVLERYVQQRRSMATRTGQQFAVGELTEEDVNGAKEYAEREIKNALVIDDLIEAEDLEIPEEDITAEIERANENATSDEQRLDDNDETRRSVMHYLKRQRTIEKVINMARGLSEDAPVEAATA
ncbi:Trigger factor [Geodia barretti]|uniref:peptidylprolyl isomerase n=1 Tax=Geodia barretti TaxID=519541 RepID=A0AA35R0G2_GEOBA|nr:Trigger factor [Geodia barretti]